MLRKILITVMVVAVFFSSLAYAGNSDRFLSDTGDEAQPLGRANITLNVTLLNGDEKISARLMDFERTNPLNDSPHGLPVRFFKVGSENLSYDSLALNVAYSEAILNGGSEKNLSIFRYVNSSWILIPSHIDEEENTLTASIDSGSYFAVTYHSGGVHVHDADAHSDHKPESEPVSASFILQGDADITLELNSRNISGSMPPGNPLKYFRINASNISYSGVNIDIAYSDDEFKGSNESSLSIFHFSNSTWTGLPTRVDEKENRLNAFSDSLSLFAISSVKTTCEPSEMGIISSCLRCHGSSSPGESQMEKMAPKINETVMNFSIHSNLSSAGGDLNRACWACHSNSTTPPVKHPMHKPALTCTSCHVNSTEKFKSPLTTEHTPHAANITVNATCQLCHGKSQMINFNGITVNSTISHYGKKRTDMLDPNKTSTNCSYCHKDPGSEFSDVFNRTSLTNITHDGSLVCSSCHGTGRLHNSTLVNMQGYSLSNCVQCHGIKGFAINKISESIMNQSIHANLNNGSLDLNRACWACHSNLLSKPEMHPDIARVPDTCSACHVRGTLNLTIKPNGGHVSSHNPDGGKLKTSAACTVCHSNNILATGKTINSTVSHYAIYPKVDTRDCVTCHQNKEIRKKWGNPPDPRETITLSSVEKKLVSDDIWRINQNYSISISEVDKEGKSVWVELYDNERPIRKELIPEGGGFKYETKLAQEGDNKTIIDLRIADIFYGGEVSLITFTGLVPRHVHTETTSVQCYACHVKEYRQDKPDGQKYFVLKKDDPNVTLNPLDIDFAASDKKTLYSNNSWNLGSGYELYIKDFSPDRKYVWLVLTKDNIKVKEEFVSEGEYFTFNTTLNGEDITMLRLKVANIFLKG